MLLICLIYNGLKGWKSGSHRVAKLDIPVASIWMFHDSKNHNTVAPSEQRNTSTASVLLIRNVESVSSKTTELLSGI